MMNSNWAIGLAGIPGERTGDRMDSSGLGWDRTTLKLNLSVTGVFLILTRNLRLLRNDPFFTFLRYLTFELNLLKINYNLFGYENFNNLI